MSAAKKLDVSVRRLEPGDIGRAGEVLYAAFNQVFSRHGYPPPIPDVDAGRALAQAYHDYESDGCFVAVMGRQVIGSAFLHRRGARVGVGPVTVDPKFQGRGVGRRMMVRLLDEVAGCDSVRLYQDAFNRESFSLYVRLGFAVRGVMAILRAEPPDFGPVDLGGSAPRPMLQHELDDVRRCDLELTGLDRPQDLEFLWLRGPSQVIEENGRITGYAVTFLAGDTLFIGPAAARDEASLMALTAAVCAEVRPRIVTIRAPAEPAGILAGLLRAGFVVRSLGTYMVRGAYETPPGAFLSSLFPETL